MRDCVGRQRTSQIISTKEVNLWEEYVEKQENHAIVDANASFLAVELETDRLEVIRVIGKEEKRTTLFEQSMFIDGQTGEIYGVGSQLTDRFNTENLAELKLVMRHAKEKVSFAIEEMDFSKIGIDSPVSEAELSMRAIENLGATIERCNQD